MARPSATAALLLLLVVSLLAVAHCRTVAVAADHDTEPEPTTAVAVVNDEKAATDEAAALPAEPQHRDFEFLRLPSHRIHHHRHRPCSLHRHLWWKRHHGVFRDAPRRFHDHGERRGEVSHLAILSPEEARETAEEVKPVAEPDPDRSLPGSDGEGQLVASREPPFFADADGHDGERAAAVRAWKKEMLRRWFHFHFHHGSRRHRLHHVHHDQEQEEEAAAEDMDMKRFHSHHHHHDEEDEEKDMMRKRLRHAEHDKHDEDSDDEDEDVEEMVRRFRKAIMRRKFGHGHGHGRRFFHHLHHNHSHRHAEEAEKQQAAGGEEESGVMAWIKGLMNF